MTLANRNPVAATPVPIDSLLPGSYVLAPTAVGALPLVIARHHLGDCDDAGLTLGAGSPAIVIDVVPDCGCDACDSGSADLVEVVVLVEQTGEVGVFGFQAGDQVTVFGEHWDLLGGKLHDGDNHRHDTALCYPE